MYPIILSASECHSVPLLIKKSSDILRLKLQYIIYNVKLNEKQKYISTMNNISIKYNTVPRILIRRFVFHDTVRPRMFYQGTV